MNSVHKHTRSIFDIKNKHTNKYKNICCSNCGEYGHIIRFCDKPVRSYGIILYSLHKNIIKYVMICRKHSIGYIEFIRGNYKIDNINYLYTIFDIMTDKELYDIQTLSFKELWNNLWNHKHNVNTEFKKSKNKFYDLKNNKYSVTLDKLITHVKNHYPTPEWGFPKGRKNINESIKEASIREVYEETNIKSSTYDIKLRDNREQLLFTEEYEAFNNKIYNLSYYIAELHDINIPKIFNKHQENEISDIGMFSLQEIKKKIRPYYKEKIKLIQRVDTHIRTHLLDK
jgi:ADP-ribose pyrophosphatase YjhB (NUDIX family)